MTNVVAVLQWASPEYLILTHDKHWLSWVSTADTVIHMTTCTKCASTGTASETAHLDRTKGWIIILTDCISCGDESFSTGQGASSSGRSSIQRTAAGTVTRTSCPATARVYAASPSS